MACDEKLLGKVFDGVCTVYASEPAADRLGWESGVVERVLYEGVPCHFFQTAGSIVEPGNLGEVIAAGTLYLSAEPNIPAGSRVEIEQYGRKFTMKLSGLPRKYVIHQEVSLKMMDEIA